jgi:hypothetical protein
VEVEILELLWLFKATHALFSAYGASPEMSSRGKELLVPLILKLEGIRLEPTSYVTFQTFMRICDEESKSMSPMLMHCYLTKFVLPEFEYMTKVGRPQTLSSEFLTVLGTLAIQLIRTEDFGTIFSSSAAKSTAGKEYDMILCRSIVDVMYKSYCQHLHHKHICPILNSIFAAEDPAGLKFLQMFVERVSVDLVSSGDNSGEVSLVGGMKAQSQAHLKRFFDLSEQTEAVSHGSNLVVQLARSKLLLKMYALDVLASLKEALTTKTCSMPAFAASLKQVTDVLLPAQIYTLTCILRAGGKNALVLYLQQVKPPVLPFGVLSIDPNAAKIKMLDPFSMLCNYQAYNSACTAVIQVQLRSSIDPVDAWSKNFVKEYKQSSWTDKICLLIAAIHTQISGSGLPVAQEMVENLIDWVRLDFNARKTAVTNPSTTSISLNLYLDLIRCCLRCQNGHRYKQASDSRQCLLDNLRMHATVLASSSASGWLNALLTDPVSLNTSYLPAMMDDESVAMMQFTDSHGNVQELGWYECPNGHRYAVGECTLPMQEARCPECKALIGGRNHTAVGGVKRLGKTSETTSNASKQGYLLSVTIGPQAHDIFRLGKLTTIVLRLTQHLIMLSSSKMYPELSVEMKEGKCGARSVVGPLMYPDSKKAPEVDLVRGALDERITSDWEALLAVLQMNEEDVAMGMHMMLNKLYFTGESKYTADESSYGKAMTGTSALLFLVHLGCRLMLILCSFRSPDRTPDGRTGERHPS